MSVHWEGLITHNRKKDGKGNCLIITEETDPYARWSGLVGLEDGHPDPLTLDWDTWDVCPTLSPRDSSTWWSQTPMVVTSQESTLNWPLSLLSPPLSHSPSPLPVLLGHPPPLNRQVLNTCLRVCFWSKRAGRVGIDCSGYSTHALPSGSPLPPLILWSAGLTPPIPPQPHQTPRASSWPKHPMGYTECVDQGW